MGAPIASDCSAPPHARPLTEAPARPTPISVHLPPASRRRRVGARCGPPEPRRPPNGHRPLAGGSDREQQPPTRTHRESVSVKRKHPFGAMRASARSLRTPRTRPAPGNTRGRASEGPQSNSQRLPAARRAPTRAESSGAPSPADAPPPGGRFLAPPVRRQRWKRAARVRQFSAPPPSPDRPRVESPKPAVAAVSGRLGPAGY